MTTDTSQTPWVDRPGPKYSWDLAPPVGAFWEDVGWHAATTFTCRYSSQELELLELDSTLPRLEKLKLLQHLLEERLAQKENSVAPEKLEFVDRATWHGLHYSIAMLAGYQGHWDLAADRYEKLSLKADGTPNAGTLQAIATALYNQGKYAESEECGVVSLKAMRKDYGIDSPPGLGILRQMVRIVAVQGKFDMAKNFLDECRVVVGGLNGGKFEKYFPEEQESLEETATFLEQIRTTYPDFERTLMP
jgi:hypothetical protein